MRSHAHVIRAANRAGTRVPTLHCDWADGDSPITSPDVPLKPVAKKKVSGKGSAEKEKARSQEDERETLLARIGKSSSYVADNSRTRRPTRWSDPSK